MSGPAQPPEQRRRSVRVAAALLSVAALGIAVGVFVAVSGGDDRSSRDPTPATSQTSPTTTVPSATDGETDRETAPATGPTTIPASAYLMAVRHGRAVVMTTIAGEYVAPLQGDQPDPAVVEELRATPDAMASQLCIYTEAGC